MDSDAGVQHLLVVLEPLQQRLANSLDTDIIKTFIK